MDKVEDIVGRLHWDSTHCRDRIGDTIRRIGRDCAEAADLIQSQQALIEEMREALSLSAEALDLAASEIEGWGSYASDYFQDKHDLPGCVNEVKEAANSARKALSQKDQIDG